MAKVYIELEAAIEMFEKAFDNSWEVSGTLDRLRAIPAAAVITWAELKGLMVDKFKSRLAAGYTPTWNDAMEVVEELRPNGGNDDV